LRVTFVPANIYEKAAEFGGGNDMRA
jgi:hypothetical protein